MHQDAVNRARIHRSLCGDYPGLERGDQLNERQRATLNRLLDGFEGKLTSSKYAKLAKCSQDTALRDIDDLVVRGVLRKDPAGGRSTSYSLVLPPAKPPA
jgi:predicted HTH transcriptional regulator